MGGMSDRHSYVACTHTWAGERAWPAGRPAGRPARSLGLCLAAARGAAVPRCATGAAHVGGQRHRLLGGRQVRAPQLVLQREKLAVVVVELEVVLDVMIGAVDDAAQRRAVRDVHLVVDRDRPQLHAEEEQQVQVALQREQEHEKVVRKALHEAVDGRERDGGEWRWHLPAVVLLVNERVQRRVVEDAVDPVDAEVGEEDEADDADRHVRPAAVVGHRRVELRVAAQLGEPHGQRVEAHDEQAPRGAANLLAHLVLERQLVLQQRAVEQQVEVERREDEVERVAHEPHHAVHAHRLPHDVLARPPRRRRVHIVEHVVVKLLEYQVHRAERASSEHVAAPQRVPAEETSSAGRPSHAKFH
eukprot:CAMPEP_0198310660 /NCGR_PEP_ID=MMETSP1450-20131203/2654_1 /TAXON_ID=753684 ORGANISM="Madagascaria erythrocladiodes, Strain CCMP3234" /NCGR_SAMPLE_ID=MMETSP1450 /ASSEMBLY_ACC=CAM_ASM_001115 /LENGTH=358 /DNA_ID=CAMNT_0044013503 /DNA_START=50 /DNA_END=1123 /DNA_ORIENTATION=-